MKELREHYVVVRFTEKEYDKLALRMSLSGYNNRSKFIRETILTGRLQRRNYSKTDSNLVREIAMLRSELRQIGINYNQRVKALNTIVKLRDKNGHSLINSHDIDRDMTEMKKMMDGMVKIVQDISVRVEEPHNEETSTFHVKLPNNTSMQTMIISGNLAKDCEVITGKDGNEYIRFDVAVNDEKDKEEKPTYYTCRMRKNGIADYLKKGRFVSLFGPLKVSIVTKETKTYVNLDIWVQNLELPPVHKES